jgi:hypothetical protein
MAPFERWRSQGEIAQIPWKVRAINHGLTMHQRLLAHFEVIIPGRELVARKNDGRILMFLEVSDSAGRPYRNFGVLDLSTLEDGVRKHPVESVWEAFILPDDYSYTLAIWDEKSNEHSFFRGALRVDPIKNDPLPNAWDGLPAVDFWAPYKDGPETMFHPDVESRLYLPVAAQRAVRYELIADLTPSDVFHGSTFLYKRYLSGLLPTFKALSQVRIPGAEMDAVAIDLRQQKVTFHQERFGEIDWTRLKPALDLANGPAMIDMKRLQSRENPVFLREHIAQLAMAREESASAGAAHPLTVFIVIGSPMDSYHFPSLPPMESGMEENCLIYYVQLEPFNPRRPISGEVGKVEKMLKPLKTRSFMVRSPQDARHALARILDEVGQVASSTGLRSGLANLPQPTR